MFKKLILLLFFIPEALFLRAQVADSLGVEPYDPLEGNIEAYSEATESETDFTEWEEELENLERRPVNINGDADELKRLFFLNEQQIQNILSYRQQYGQLMTIFELQMIEGFDIDLAMKMSRYIAFSAYELRKFSFKDILRQGHPDLVMRYQQVVQKAAGFEQVSDSIRQLSPNSHYLGDRGALMLRLNYTWYDRFNAGVVAEKDAGEAMFPKSDTLKKGFDYYSFHVFAKDIGKLKYIALGDYHLQFGQGLTLWNGFSMGIASSMLPSRKRAPTIKPHSSASEFAYLRGAAATFQLWKFDITGFYSNRKIDGNATNYDTVEQEYFVSTFQETGLHRTPGELEDKNLIRQQVAGGHLGFSIPRLKLGATLYNIQHDIAGQENTALYKKFISPEINNTYAGIDYAFSYKTLTIYGEGSYQLDYGWATVHGLTFTPDPRIGFSAVYRNFSKDYYNRFATAFGQGSTNTNERGFYLGMSALLGKKFTLVTYADMFSYPWLKFRVDQPSQGHELSAMLTYAISRRGEMKFRVRKLSTPINAAVSEASYLTPVISTDRTYFNWQLNYQALSWLSLRSRIYLIDRKAEGDRQYGYFIGQDFVFRPENAKYSLTFRYAMFRTDAWDARIYVYENDLPYTFSVPAFNGAGSRFYALFKLSTLGNADIYLRYALTHYTDRTEISSGPDLIEGNNKSDFKVMLHLNF